MCEKLKLVRGARLLQWLEEAPYSDLERGTMNFTPPTKKRQNATGPIQIQKMMIMPYPQDGVIRMRGTAKSDSGNTYSPTIQFENIEYQEEDTPQNITFKGVDNEDYHIIQIDLRSVNARVRCNCLDFYWRFGTWDHRVKSLLGNPPGPYVRKTNTHPPANASQTPGVCKHLLKLVDQLKQSRIAR